MRTRALRTGVCTAVVVAAMGGAVHAGDGETPTRITDPQVLASLGLPANAQNIYAFVSRLNQPPSTATEPQDYFGGTASGFSILEGQDFKPRINAPPGNTGGWGTLNTYGDIYRTAGDPLFEAGLDIPNGARLQAVRWWALDSDPINDIQFAVVQICLPNQGPPPGVPATVVLASQSTLGSSGNQSQEVSINQTVDTKTCSYRVSVQLLNATPAHLLYRVRAQWVRQVSNPPQTARFIDVPTNHPFFRFIEALAASGITGGCSANQYCPDAAVTRGQMAVFLATALGLNWGGL